MSSRFLEVLGLGGLIGLLAFRWLVWAPGVRDAGVAGEDRDAVLGWGRDVFWVGFGALAVGAMLAEGYLLVVQSASVLGTSVLDALGNATGISQVLGDTRFGSLVQLRGALLFAPLRDRRDHVHPRVRQRRLAQAALGDRLAGRGGAHDRCCCSRCSAASRPRGTRA